MCFRTDSIQEDWLCCIIESIHWRVFIILLTEWMKTLYGFLKYLYHITSLCKRRRIIHKLNDASNKLALTHPQIHSNKTHSIKFKICNFYLEIGSYNEYFRNCRQENSPRSSQFLIQGIHRSIMLFSVRSW